MPNLQQLVDGQTRNKQSEKKLGESANATERVEWVLSQTNATGTEALTYGTRRIPLGCIPREVQPWGGAALGTFPAHPTAGWRIGWVGSEPNYSPGFSKRKHTVMPSARQRRSGRIGNGRKHATGCLRVGVGWMDMARVADRYLPVDAPWQA